MFEYIYIDKKVLKESVVVLIKYLIIPIMPHSYSEASTQSPQSNQEVPLSGPAVTDSWAKIRETTVKAERAGSEDG